MRPSPRDTAALAVATAAALALGALWWTSNAPPPSSLILGPSTPAPTAVLTGAPEPATYPHPSEIVQFDVDRVERILPERDDPLRREAGVLTEGGTIDYSGPVPAGAGFLLEVACLGEGELEIDVVTPDGSVHDRRLGCDGALGEVEFTASTVGQAVIRVVARTGRFVGVAVQLVER
jgi:hypothetical protein